MKNVQRNNPTLYQEANKVLQEYKGSHHDPFVQDLSQKEQLQRYNVVLNIAKIRLEREARRGAGGGGAVPRSVFSRSVSGRREEDSAPSPLEAVPKGKVDETASLQRQIDEVLKVKRMQALATRPRYATLSTEEEAKLRKEAVEEANDYHRRGKVPSPVTTPSRSSHVHPLPDRVLSPRAIPPSQHGGRWGALSPLPQYATEVSPSAQSTTARRRNAVSENSLGELMQKVYDNDEALYDGAMMLFEARVNHLDDEQQKIETFKSSVEETKRQRLEASRRASEPPHLGNTPGTGLVKPSSGGGGGLEEGSSYHPFRYRW